MSAWTLWDIYQGWTSNFKLVWKVRMNAKCRTACLESVRLTTSKYTPLGRAQGTNQRGLNTIGQLTVIALWRLLQKEMLDVLQEGLNLFRETFWLQMKNSPDTFNTDCAGGWTVFFKMDFWLACVTSVDDFRFQRTVVSIPEQLDVLALGWAVWQRPGPWMVSCSWHYISS